jgi:ribokinase
MFSFTMNLMQLGMADTRGKLFDNQLIWAGVRQINFLDDEGVLFLAQIDQSYLSVKLMAKYPCRCIIIGMKILNLGSINIDHVYAVDHFVRPGETLASSSYTIFAGGKGFNQSIALARAGAQVLHAGMIGKDGSWLLERLAENGVDTAQVEAVEGATGHAIIQVVPSGENSIVLHAGANHQVSDASLPGMLSSCSAGDYFLLQNETSAVSEAIRLAVSKGLKVVFNPAPMTNKVKSYQLESVDLFILNETEAETLIGETSSERIRSAIRDRFPTAAVVLTLGSKGAVYFDASATIEAPAAKVEAVDTTAAGDTFTGYFLAELMSGGTPEEALMFGCQAAALCVTRPGASDSIPLRDEVKKALL